MDSPPAMHEDSSPTSGAPRVVRIEDLSRLIQEKRGAERLTLEQAARRVGVSAATLSRLERRQIATRGNGDTPATPDTRTLAAVTRWLGVSLERVVDVGVPKQAHTIVHHAGEATPDIVAAHLRADRHLDPKTAAALGRIFRAAYEQFAHTDDTSDEQDTDAPSTREQPNATRRPPHNGGTHDHEHDAATG